MAYIEEHRVESQKEKFGTSLPVKSLLISHTQHPKMCVPTEECGMGPKSRTCIGGSEKRTGRNAACACRYMNSDTPEDWGCGLLHHI